MKKTKSFLGQGWAFPPAFARDINSVLLSSEDDNIRENLSILLSTRIGERIMCEQYGTVLRSLLFEESDGLLQSAISDTIRNAMVLYEPRVKLADVSVNTDPNDSSTLLVHVSYTVITTNTRRNFVFPFHIIEGTHLIRSA